MKSFVALLSALLLLSFTNPTEPYEGGETEIYMKYGKHIGERFMTPQNFVRVNTVNNSFGDYLRNLPLMPHGYRVHLYDGRLKKYDTHEAVINMDIGDKDLQQCADAIMRLRAEYLYDQKRYNEIHFNFTNGFKAEYSKWAEGYRIKVRGKKVNWVKTEDPANDYETFRDYLEFVFMFAGTHSLEKELQPAAIENIRPGDIFIDGGFPGHAIIVVDVAEHAETGQKMFMLAQSFMPAQEIHIVKNPVAPKVSPWYSLANGNELITPEWTFSADDLMRFE